MARRKTSAKMAAVASGAMRDDAASERERKLAASVLSQVEPEPLEHRSHRRDGSLAVEGERWPERKKLQAAE